MKFLIAALIAVGCATVQAEHWSVELWKQGTISYRTSLDLRLSIPDSSKSDIIWEWSDTVYCQDIEVKDQSRIEYSNSRPYNPCAEKDSVIAELSAKADYRKNLGFFVVALYTVIILIFVWFYRGKR